jgi:amino acid adenylation domain-containing protein
MTQEKTYLKGRIIDRFLESARRYPDRPALQKGPVGITYAMLRSSAESIADQIFQSGDDRPLVGVIADKSIECYAAILGILMAGKGYLPLNPRFPESRNRFIIEKAGVRSVFENGRRTSQVTSQVPHTKPDPAYLLFTSGTTGEPKGVQVSNKNVSAYLDFMLKTYDFSGNDRFTQNFDLTFDLSVHDLFLCWSVGACLCVPEDSSSFSMARFIREKQPTAWFSVPSVVMLMERMRVVKPGAFPSIRLCFFCGEPLFVRTVEAWRPAVPNAKIINLYGPTEATIAISHYEIPPVPEQIKQELGIVSIGRIFDGNSWTSQVTCEVTPVELCLSGAQIIDGYFNNPEADQQSFFTDEKTLDKCYKTGDLVKSDQDGDLFYLGRTDSEVKISGYRVNLREIENVINTYESVDQAVIIHEVKNDGQAVLHAIIISKTGHETTIQQIDGFCRERLPWYMLPGNVIFVKEFPLSNNGKVDRTALKEKYIHGK